MNEYAGSVQWLYVRWTEFGPSPTTIVAFIVAYIAFRQWRVASDKLKLDLYEKRWRIYEQAISLYKNSFRGVLPDEVKDAFTLTIRGSIFLFDPKDGIKELLEQLFKDCTGKSDKINVVGDPTIRSESTLLQIEAKLGKYLSFHKA